jgi:hypothetical protein
MDLRAGTGAEISEPETKVLRRLGERLAEIAALPIQQVTASNWRALNGLRPVKPLVWVDEIPWHEMDVNGELRLETTSAWARYHEWELRKLIYQWEHMPADMVVEPVAYSPLVVSNTGFGFTEDTDVVVTDTASTIVSRHYKPQLRNDEDLERLRVPVVTHDSAASEQQYQQLRQIMGGALEVKKRGANGFCFVIFPWDMLAQWWGLQELLVDLHDRPEFVHKAIDKMVNACLSTIDQLEAQDLLTLNNAYHRIGSGGLGYTDELPPEGFDPDHVRAKDLWIGVAAQLFSCVSPRMHWEFALQYELRILNRFGLTYYGCCDPLHRKMAMLERVPNLRKVSMNFLVNVDEAVGSVGNRYVFSYKPHPAVFATGTWDLDHARQELATVLAKAKAHGCFVEVIMKDISTVQYQPQRLWEWARMATEVAAQYGP